MSDLLDKLQSAAEGSRELDWRIAWRMGHPSMKGARDDFFPPFVPCSRSDELIPHYSTNLQDAVSLVSAPWRPFRMNWSPDAVSIILVFGDMSREATAATAPLAVCSAIIKARKEMKHYRLVDNFDVG